MGVRFQKDGDVLELLFWSVAGDAAARLPGPDATEEGSKIVIGLKKFADRQAGLAVKPCAAGRVVDRMHQATESSVAVDDARAGGVFAAVEIAIAVSFQQFEPELGWKTTLCAQAGRGVGYIMGVALLFFCPVFCP